MASPWTEERIGEGAKRSLKDELSSLRIERERPRYDEGPSRGRDRGPSRGIGAGILWLIPLALLAGGAYVGYEQYKQYRPKRTVVVTTVQQMTAGEAQKLLSAKGYIKARRQAAVGTKIPGRISKLLVEEGSRVSAGDLIAELEHNDMDAQLRSGEMMLEKAKAELGEANAELLEKAKRAERLERLQYRNTASVDELDKAVAARDIARSRLLALQANLKVIESQIQETREGIRNMEIRAPFDGTVLNKEAEQGETINTMSLGASGGRSALVTLADLQDLEVETEVAENLLSRIAIGQPAEISVSAVPGRAYQGKLTKIVRIGDRATATVKVLVEVLNEDDDLFPELAATVNFLPDSTVPNPNAGKSLLFVAKGALIEEKGQTFVWVVDARNRIARRPVQVVVSNDALARVDEGLKPGDTVIVGPDASLREGDEVQYE